MGFQIDPVSKAYANPWIIKNRYEGKAAIYEEGQKGLKLLDYPETNILLVCKKVT